MKHIKNFESSYFHSMDDIDGLLDKINDEGYTSLNKSDKAILLNYSKDDDDIHGILVKLNALIEDFFQLKRKLEVVVASDGQEALTKIKDKAEKTVHQIKSYEDMLKYLYKIDSPEEVGNYMKNTGIINDN